jgi:hypothetical protein
MKRALAAVSLVTSLATFIAFGTGPAMAEPARASSARGVGLSATGLVAIGPTVVATAAAPPDQDVAVAPKLLNVPLGSLALAGVVGSDAHAHQADNLGSILGPVPTNNLSRPVALQGVSALGFAKTAGAALVFNAGTNPDAIRVALANLLNATGGLLGADAISAEAVAKCVNNQPVFDAGFQVAGLGGLLGAPLNPVAQSLLNILLGLIGPGASLSSIITIAPGVVTPLADGIAIDGLRVSVPLLNENIVISHAEAHMPPGCRVPPATPPAHHGGPGGPGGGGVGGTGLAATGSDVPYLPMGIVLVTLGLLGTGVVRRSRRASAL